MTISLSELYGKKIITGTGSVLGEVKEVILNLEDGAVSHLLLTRLEHLARSEDVKRALQKSSVLYKRVKNVAQTIIVSVK